MPSQLTAYRVFIASPGGLEDERKKFRDAIQDYNNLDAIERGVIFVPVGWEATLGGIGRPQKLINSDVRRSDYFVMLLWDRWGSAPEVLNQGPFTSGSEEEFTVALESHQQGVMRNLIIFFKAIEPQKLRDPDHQLGRVLEFRERIESEKKLLFETFDETRAFEKKLQQHMARWIRDHEKGFTPEGYAGVSPLDRTPAHRVQVTAQGLEMTRSTLADDAGVLASEGQLTKAERQLVTAVVGEPEAEKQLDAANQYGALLQQMGKLSQATDAFRRVQVMAQELGSKEWEIIGLRNLAKVFVSRDQLADAEASYLQVVDIQEQAVGPNDADLADSLNELGELYHSIGRYQDAESVFRRALKIQGLPNAS